MNVLFVSAEVDPFAKVGGLADVVGSLPKALRERGIDARVLMPYYGFIDQARFNIQPLFSFDFERRTGLGARRSVQRRNTTACRSTSCARCPTSGKNARLRQL